MPGLYKPQMVFPVILIPSESERLVINQCCLHLQGKCFPPVSFPPSHLYEKLYGSMGTHSHFPIGCSVVFLRRQKPLTQQLPSSVVQSPHALDLGAAGSHLCLGPRFLYLLLSSHQKVVTNISRVLSCILILLILWRTDQGKVNSLPYHCTSCFPVLRTQRNIT